MILVNFKEYYSDHDCWGSRTTESRSKWAEFKSIDEWLAYRAKSGDDIEFVRAYVVAEVIE